MVMKIIQPDYYKDFKCIADKCEDTCCAGWEVDVDDEKYHFYKTVGGALGKRLKEVMQPKKKGEGCSFKLKENKRCPFLNDSNLCDIITELGEEAICETCTDYPRFIRDYGQTREIGLVPSCFTAAQLMAKKKKLSQIVATQDDDLKIELNDIDAELFFELKDLRSKIFLILADTKKTTEAKLIKALDLAVEYEKELGESMDAGALYRGKKDPVKMFFKPFEGMETVNPKWLEYVDETHEHEISREDHIRLYRKIPQLSRALEELAFYYFYRYILEAVYDSKILTAAKTAVAAFLCCRQICIMEYMSTGKLSTDDMAEIFHVYSRHVEHSVTNWDGYLHEYENNTIYSVKTLKKILEGKI